jgi:hypothetical protein
LRIFLFDLRFFLFRLRFPLFSCESFSLACESFHLRTRPRSATQPKSDRDRSGFVSIAVLDLAADRDRSNVIRLTQSTFGGIELREIDLALSPEKALVSALQIIEYLSRFGVDIGASRTRSLG